MAARFAALWRAVASTGELQAAARAAELGREVAAGAADPSSSSSPYPVDDDDDDEASLADAAARCPPPAERANTVTVPLGHLPRWPGNTASAIESLFD